jgi:16S rRNA (uracil1498-N3)-methyltransferase
MFIVDATALGAERIVVDGAEGRHAADVRRLRVGEAVALTDGNGTLVRGVVSEVSRGRIIVDARERIAVPPRQPRFVVVQAMAKGGRDEAAVEAMTEVGVDEVLGWQAARSIAQWTDRTASKWQSTAREAAKQSRRCWLPFVFGPVTTADVVERVRSASLAVVLDGDAADPLAGVSLPSTGDVLVIVGPEGGIASDEIDAFGSAGARAVRLGDTVLRSSTAGVAALSVLSAAVRWS